MRRQVNVDDALVYLPPNVRHVEREVANLLFKRTYVLPRQPLAISYHLSALT